MSLLEISSHQRQGRNVYIVWTRAGGGFANSVLSGCRDNSSKNSQLAVTGERKGKSPLIERNVSSV